MLNLIILLVIATSIISILILLIIRKVEGETEIKIDFARGKFEIKRKS